MCKHLAWLVEMVMVKEADKKIITIEKVIEEVK
jgi:hypothetical protein